MKPRGRDAPKHDILRSLNDFSKINPNINHIKP